MFKKTQPTDTLGIGYSEQAMQTRAWLAKQERYNRKLRRQRIRTELLRDPALGIALLFAPVLRCLTDKAAGIINQREEAVFARAAEETMQREARARAEQQQMLAKQDAHVRDRHRDIMVKQGAWWMERK